MNQSASGGTGRHSSLRSCRRKAWEFESPLAHHRHGDGEEGKKEKRFSFFTPSLPSLFPLIKEKKEKKVIQRKERKENSSPFSLPTHPRFFLSVKERNPKGNLRVSLCSARVRVSCRRLHPQCSPILTPGLPLVLLSLMTIPFPRRSLILTAGRKRKRMLG